MTPTTATGLPLSGIVRPSTPGSPPKRDCQYPCERMTAGGPFGRISSSEKVRPRAGAARSSVNRFAVTGADSTRSGSRPAPPTVTDPTVNAATSSSARACCR